MAHIYLFTGELREQTWRSAQESPSSILGSLMALPTDERLGQMV